MAWIIGALAVPDCSLIWTCSLPINHEIFGGAGLSARQTYFFPCLLLGLNLGWLTPQGRQPVRLV
jgi:hypothetical protein